MDRLGALFAIIFAGVLLYAAVESFNGGGEPDPGEVDGAPTAEIDEGVPPASPGDVPGA